MSGVVEEYGVYTRVIDTGLFTANPRTPGDPTCVYATRSGQLTVAEIGNLLGLQGLAFAVNWGQGTTFVTAKLGPQQTNAQPDLDLDIPTGTAIIPLRFQVAFGAMAGTANHFFLFVGNGVIGAGTSSAATAGPTPFGSGFVSKCTARQAYSGSGTAPGSLIEVFSVEDPTAGTGSVPLVFSWTPPTLLPIIGPASIVGYGISTTTALTFKAQLVYVEVPAQLFT